jgi:8-oxo-dGTP pyrophosphatase MutT (NUDIX family)
VLGFCIGVVSCAKLKPLTTESVRIRNFATMTKRQNLIYKGSIINVTVDTVQLPDGTRFELEVVHHPGGAAVVALDDNDRVCMLRQYRHVANGWLWELPAGKLDVPETPLHTAQRELQEEAGLQAQSWISLGSLLTSPGVFKEVIHLFLARKLSVLHRRPERDELIEVHWVPFKEALDWAHRGKIVDAKSLIGLFRTQVCVEHQNE